MWKTMLRSIGICTNRNGICNSYTIAKLGRKSLFCPKVESALIHASPFSTTQRSTQTLSKNQIDFKKDAQFLLRLAQLCQQLRATTSEREKTVLLQTSSDLPLIERITLCAPLHVTSKALNTQVSTTNEPSTFGLSDLISALEQRSLTGHNAIRAIQEFTNCIKDHLSSDQFRLVEETIKDILNRDLRIGMGKARLTRAFSILPLNLQKEHIHISSKPSHHFFAKPRNGSTLPVALGMPIQKAGRIFEKTKGDDWLVSRKLDGVRCLTLARRGEQGITVYSRAGNVLNVPHIFVKNLEETCRFIFDHHSELDWYYLDGEVCSMVSDQSLKRTDEVAPSLLEQSLWTDPVHLKDDFNSIMSMVGSNDPNEVLKKTNAVLSYYVFDIFNDQLKFLPLLDRLHKLDPLKLLLNRPESMVRLLPQVAIKEPTVLVDKLLDKCRSLHWEGLILRRNAQHQAKRSRDLLKVKDYYEAEYAIKDYKLEMMAVLEDGRQTEELLLSAVAIEHGGTVVWVGSGFSLQQRQELALNPDVLLSSHVTVRYFEESSNQKNPSKSLRFPTIKAVWTTAPRSV